LALSAFHTLNGIGVGLSPAASVHALTYESSPARKHQSEGPSNWRTKSSILARGASSTGRGAGGAGAYGGIGTNAQGWRRVWLRRRHSDSRNHSAPRKPDVRRNIGANVSMIEVICAACAPIRTRLDWKTARRNVCLNTFVLEADPRGECVFFAQRQAELQKRIRDRARDPFSIAAGAFADRLNCDSFQPLDLFFLKHYGAVDNLPASSGIVIFIH
jgi:hypothetical protein